MNTQKPKPRNLKNPDLSPSGPYATADDIGIARERSTTVRQVRRERASDDVAALAPPIRKVASKSHKCFGRHSRILTDFDINPPTGLEHLCAPSGRRVGDKQICPGEYGHPRTESRTRAELRNDAERKHDA